MERPLTLVLDTNIVLDLFWFSDPAVAPLGTALTSGAAVCMTDADCYEELRRVLAYPRLGVPPAEVDRVLVSYRALASFQPGPDDPGTDIPQCSDPDDQKFLRLAHRSKADLLLTKDKALLSLSRKTLLRAGFRVVAPQAAARMLAEWRLPQS